MTHEPTTSAVLQQRIATFQGVAEAHNDRRRLVRQIIPGYRSDSEVFEIGELYCETRWLERESNELQKLLNQEWRGEIEHDPGIGARRAARMGELRTLLEGVYARLRELCP